MYRIVSLTLSAAAAATVWYPIKTEHINYEYRNRAAAAWRSNIGKFLMWLLGSGAGRQSEGYGPPFPKRMPYPRFMYAGWMLHM